MDFELGDVIKMKKAHPCGTNQWEILRVGLSSQMLWMWSSGYASS